MAIDCLAVRGKENPSADYFCYGFFLHTGLWHDDDSRCTGNLADRFNFLLNAETVCSWNDWFCKRVTTFLYLDKLASGSNLAVITAGFLYTFLKKIQIIKNNPKNKKLPRKSQSFGEHSPKKNSKLHGNMSTKKNRS